jgi:hypothetical protein
MWEQLSRTSGGGLECTVRNHKAVRGKQGFCVYFDFAEWDATVPALAPRGVSARQSGPLASRSASRSLPCHRFRFESGAGTGEWTLREAVLTTALLCTLLGWHPQGGSGLRAVAKKMKALRPILGPTSAPNFPRKPVTRAAPAPVPVPTALCGLLSDSAPAAL